jgi:hypothetical protein
MICRSFTEVIEPCAKRSIAAACMELIGEKRLY